MRAQINNSSSRPFYLYLTLNTSPIFAHRHMTYTSMQNNNLHYGTLKYTVSDHYNLVFIM